MDFRGTTLYYINLRRAGERDRTLRQRLSELGLAATRIEAVDGAALPGDLPGFRQNLYGWTHGRELRPGEIGCQLSHLRALETFYASAAEFALIFEDDAILDASLPSLVAALTSGEAPRDWDLVKLQSIHRSKPVRLRPLDGGHWLAAMLYRTSGAAAYLVNRHAARVLLERLLPMRVPYDHAFDRGWFLGLRVRAVYPFPVRCDWGEGAPVSAIENIRPRHLGGLPFATTMLYRAATESARFASALAARFARSGQRAGCGGRRFDDPPLEELTGIYCRNRELWKSF